MVGMGRLGTVIWNA